VRYIVKASLFIVLSSASVAFAQTPIPLTVSGNQVQGRFELPGGISGDLTITFESADGLTPTALEASASLVSPLDLALLGRLPGLVSVPVAFPVLLRIGPSASSALSFEGEYTMSLHTLNLELDCAVPKSLLKSPDGGLFQDVTKLEGRGSYRDDGSGGDFSEFMIVIDNRPIDTVIAGKFNALQATLTNYGALMPPTVVSALQTFLSQARTFYQSGDTLGAIGQMTTFSDYVKAHSGTDIPDVWRANDPNTVNVAGLLRSEADTLKFSLDRKTSS
jgi:hypothetical protein